MWTLSTTPFLPVWYLSNLSSQEHKVSNLVYWTRLYFRDTPSKSYDSAVNSVIANHIIISISLQKYSQLKNTASIFQADRPA